MLTSQPVGLSAAHQKEDSSVQLLSAPLSLHPGQQQPRVGVNSNKIISFCHVMREPSQGKMMVRRRLQLQQGQFMQPVLPDSMTPPKKGAPQPIVCQVVPVAAKNSRMFFFGASGEITLVNDMVKLDRISPLLLRSVKCT